MTADIKTRITGQQEISPDVFYLRLKRTGDFIPGQILSLAESPGDTPRYYSICSGLQDDFWGILYNRVEDGWLTPRLSSLHRDNTLYCSPSFGRFLPVETPMVWIATGTGIAPFYSMLRSGLGSEALLVHGARRKQDFYFFNEFSKQMGSRYTACASQSPDPGLFHGRLSVYLEKEFDFPESTYYLCGSSSMVVDMRDLLLAKGVKFDHIISEIYF